MKRLGQMLLELLRCTSGSVLLEMTIVTPIAIALMAGGVDFGMALSTQKTADKSVRDAARYLGSLPSSIGCPSWAITNAKNIVVYGQISSSGTKLIPNWQTSDVTITCDSTTNDIVVSAVVPYSSIILLSLLPIPHTFNLSATHEERQVGS